MPPPPNTPEYYDIRSRPPTPGPQPHHTRPQTVRRPSEPRPRPASRPPTPGPARTSSTTSSTRSGTPASASNRGQPPRPPRSPPPVPPIDYQDLDYIDEVDETLICPICRTPFYEPITTKRCGHTFCTDCLRRAVELQPCCPIDRQPIAFHPDQLCNPRIVSHQLDRLKVRCPNIGCGFITARGLISAHYERHCELTLVPCPDGGCDKLVARGDAGSELGCLHRELRCRYCDATVLLAERERHYDTECEGHTAKCEQCNALVVRHRMREHVLESCPEGEARCKWHIFGCGMHAKRRTVELHEQAGCIYEAIAKLMRDRAEDRAVIHDLRGRLTAVERRMEGSPPPRRHRSTRPTEGFASDLDDLIDGRRQRDSRGSTGGTWDSPEDYMLAQFERIEAKIEDLRKSVTELDGRHSMMLLNETMPLKDQIAELRSHMGVIGMHTTWLMNVHRQNRGGVGTGGGAGQTQQQQQQRSNGTGGASATGSGTGRAADGDDGRDFTTHRVHVAPRRMSGENPPRL